MEQSNILLKQLVDLVVPCQLIESDYVTALKSHLSICHEILLKMVPLLHRFKSQMDHHVLSTLSWATQ